MQMVENIMFPFRFQERGFPDLADLVVEVDPDRHWIAEIEEPLDVSAPARSSPWCCYIRTVIFYGPTGEEDRCETRLQINDVLRDGEERWQVWSGSVAWTKGRWHMVWCLRKYDEARRRVV